MNLIGVVESALYVEDVIRTRDFFVSLFGFEVLDGDPGGRFAALAVAPANVLLLFRKGATVDPLTLPGGTIPPHGGTGALHFALGIAAEDYDGWKQRLAEGRVAIVSEMTWPRGGRSVYFRDPDGNLGELITPGVWRNY